jgi:hypothetical protein
MKEHCRYIRIEFSLNIRMYGGYDLGCHRLSHFISGGIFTHLAGRGSPKDPHTDSSIDTWRGVCISDLGDQIG